MALAWHGMAWLKLPVDVSRITTLLLLLLPPLPPPPPLLYKAEKYHRYHFLGSSIQDLPKLLD